MMYNDSTARSLDFLTMFSTSYDEVPYPNLCYAASHPSRTSAIARLFGMTPAPVTQCRVLELGCASGGNLIPMAWGLPESRFIGIDSSPVQIDAARNTASALKLKNIHFRTLDIRDLNADLGEFDYIIAHGIYSWVPPDVQEKLLAICRQNLAPNGLAYVSYNTLPGWHLSLMIREMMLYHTRNIEDPRERAAAARHLVEFLARMAPQAQQPVYGAFLNQYLETRPKHLGEHDLWADAALLHNELEAVNTPVYFHQFIEQAAKHELRYLAEARFSQMMTYDLSGDAVAYLHDMARSTIEREQYLDFLRHQTFRRTLLYRADLALNRRLQPGQIEHFFITSRAEIAAADPQRPHAMCFQGVDGASYITENPVTIAALRRLIQAFPQALTFPDLLMGSQADDQTAQNLMTDLLQVFSCSSQLVEFQSYMPTFSFELSAYPVACPQARLAAVHSPIVCNVRHEQIILDETQRRLLPLLDGSRDRDALAQALENDEVDSALRGLARAALLSA